MKNLNTMKVLSLAAVAGAMILAGCSTTSPAGAGGTASAKPSGSRLWAQNCARCHNSRSPSELSPAQWDVVMIHMRVRAGLTGDDSRSILEFLQTAN